MANPLNKNIADNGDERARKNISTVETSATRSLMVARTERHSFMPCLQTQTGMFRQSNCTD